MQENIVSFCPNCGHVPQAVDYMSSDWLSWEGVDALSGRFTCPNCGYMGIALETTKEDYAKMQFSPRPIRSTRLSKYPKAMGFYALWFVLTIIVLPLLQVVQQNPVWLIPISALIALILLLFFWRE
ncbi:MAG: TFIIB-type zinc ribbon-containing protein [Candidatus Micrarchaeota archaeon]